MEGKECCDFQSQVVSAGDYILPPPLQASIDKIIEKEGYITHEILKKSISTNGGNFMAELFEVDIKGKTANGDKEINVFIKNKVEDSHMTVVDVEECYTMENFFYGELSKLYDEMQDKANVPAEERFTTVKSYDANNPNAIILENLAKKGFSTVHRMEVIPLKFAQLSIQQLARFHGLSWVLQKHHPEYFGKEIKNLQCTFKFGVDYQNFINNMSTYTEKCVDEEMKAKLAGLNSNMLQILNSHYNENVTARCCLCHGDYRVSNLLTKKDGDDISDVIPVDYQLLYYGCPVMDFIYFIFPCTDSEFRKKHLEDLKNLYHDSLGKFLNYFDMDVESVYPRKEFENEFKKRLDFGLIMSLLLAPILFTGDDDVPDLGHVDLGTFSVTPDQKMEERIRGIVDDFQNWGIL